MSSIQTTGKSAVNCTLKGKLSAQEPTVSCKQTLKLPSWWDSLLHSEGSRQNPRGGFQPSRPCLALLLWVVPWEISQITHSRRKLIILVTFGRILNSRYNWVLNSDSVSSPQFLFLTQTWKKLFTYKNCNSSGLLSNKDSVSMDRCMYSYHFLY